MEAEPTGSSRGSAHPSLQHPPHLGLCSAPPPTCPCPFPSPGLERSSSPSGKKQQPCFITGNGGNSILQGPSCRGKGDFNLQEGARHGTAALDPPKSSSLDVEKGNHLVLSKGLPLGEVQVAWEQLGTLLGGCLSLRSSCSQYLAQTPPSAWPLPKPPDSASLSSHES